MSIAASLAVTGQIGHSQERMHRQSHKVLYLPEHAPVSGVVVEVLARRGWSELHTQRVCAAVTVDVPDVTAVPGRGKWPRRMDVRRVNVHVNRQTSAQAIQFSKQLPRIAAKRHASLGLRNGGSVDEVLRNCEPKGGAYERFRPKSRLLCGRVVSAHHAANLNLKPSAKATMP